MNANTHWIFNWKREKRVYIVIVGSLTFANYTDQPSRPVARNATHAAGQAKWPSSNKSFRVPGGKGKRGSSLWWFMWISLLSWHLLPCVRCLCLCLSRSLFGLTVIHGKVPVTAGKQGKFIVEIWIRMSGMTVNACDTNHSFGGRPKQHICPLLIQLIIGRAWCTIYWQNN